MEEEGLVALVALVAGDKRSLQRGGWALTGCKEGAFVGQPERSLTPDSRPAEPFGMQESHSGQKCFAGFLVNNNGPSPLGFFISVDSKQFKFSVSRLESTLLGGFGSVESKGLVCTKIVQMRLFWQVWEMNDLG